MLNCGDLVFVRGEFSSPMDDLIKTGEWILDKRPWASNYTHVAIYIGNSTVAEAQGFRKSGFASIGDYTGDYDIGKIQMTYKQRRDFLNYLEQENDLPYDWPGIFWLCVFILTFKRFGRKYHEHRRRYCSRYIEWALARVGIDVNGRTPEDLALDPLVLIEKG